jgi:hypothetical protein
MSFTIIKDPITYLKEMELRDLEMLVERVSLDTPPDLSMLNEGQREAFDYVFDFVHNFLDEEKGGPEWVVLNGPAGTGKTYVVTKIIHALLHNDGDMNIAMVGMTHKATNVARLMSPFLPPPNYKDYPDKDFSKLMGNITRIRYSTAHSILALVPKIVHKKQVFVPHPMFGDEPPILQYQVCFVDETSMMDKDIMQYFYAWSNHVMIVLIGDKEQLPPVEEDGDSSPVFQKEVQKATNMGVVSLVEVMRQAKGSPILGHATAVRLGQPAKEFENSLLSDEGDFLCHLNVLRNPQDTVDILWRLFNSEQFKRDTNYAKVLTWRREVEEKWNIVFRKKMYLEEHGLEVNGERYLPRVVAGEKLQLRAPWIQRGPAGDEIVFPNSAELTVLDTTEMVTQLHQKHVSYWRTKVEYLDPNNQERRVNHIDVLHNMEVGPMLILIDSLRKQAETLYKANNVKDGNSVWGQKVRLETMFADITYPFAGTAHRAQGTTIGYGIIAKYDGDDMLTPKMLSMNPKFRAVHKKWLYVVLSRAKFGNILIHKY